MFHVKHIVQRKINVSLRFNVSRETFTYCNSFTYCLAMANNKPLIIRPFTFTVV